MNREDTRKLIQWYERNLPAMQHYADGEEVIRTNGDGSGLSQKFSARTSRSFTPSWDINSEYKPIIPRTINVWFNKRTGERQLDHPGITLIPSAEPYMSDWELVEMIEKSQ